MLFLTPETKISEIMKIGIIGAGWIADKMGLTLRDFPEKRYAIAARDLSRAQDFADRWGFEKAYGSYEEMVCDPEVDLVYVATPHSHHYEHSMLALTHGKAVLCEKAFMANTAETEAVLKYAEEHKLFITEAIWTRYMPLSLKVKEIIDSGVIGKPLMLSATIGYPMGWKDRIQKPELCGGSLLDIGVYAINFSRMYFGEDYESVSGQCVQNELGMDLQNTISIKYRDGRMANLQSTAIAANDLQGIISCEHGFLVVDNINNPQTATVYNEDHEVLQVHNADGKITGYEYQVFACEEALSNGWLESPYMPHAETVKVMKMMDELRAQWGVEYPNDKRCLKK